jgi:hypothetical protein
MGVSEVTIHIAQALRRFFGCLAFLFLQLGSPASVHLALAQPATTSIQLVDATEPSGVDFVHRNGTAGRGYLVEAMSGGLALLDYDQDGWTDLFFTNGAPLRASTASPSDMRHALYRNLGNWRFRDVTVESGLDFRGYGLGVVAADYDSDGNPDLLITTFGTNVLYRNNGDRTFTDATASASVAGTKQVGAGACFLDADRDGRLDLFVASYVDFNYENHVPIQVKGQYLMAGPQHYPYLPDRLFRNLGNGTFEDISQASGIGNIPGPGMGVVAFDYDEDGDVDVFVAQDGTQNLLFQNDGSGKFAEVAVLAGVAGSGDGKYTGNMGVDCADIDGDGRLDLFVTNYQAELPIFFRNLGGGLFEDASRKARIPTTLLPHVNWGTGLVDFDNDGDRDVFIANGHFDRVELMDDRTSLKVANTLLQNDGQGRFVDVSKSAGNGLSIVESSRGAAFDDLDNDGDIDAVVLNSNARPSLLRNDSKTDHHWLQVQLRGSRTNRDAVGAMLRVQVGNRILVDTVIRGRSYQSHYGERLHFGLGKADQVEGLHVTWPDGLQSALNRKSGDQVLVINQDP